MVLYDVDVDNNDNKYDGPSKYNYCRPGTDSDFGSYKSLMSMAYSNCDVNKLTYHTYKHKEKFFNNDIMDISNNLSCVFDNTCPCEICGKASHTFEECE